MTDPATQSRGCFMYRGFWVTLRGIRLEKEDNDVSIDFAEGPEAA